MSRRAKARFAGEPVMEQVPGKLQTSLDRSTGVLTIEFVDPDDSAAAAQLERGLKHRERCTTPSPTLIERLKRLNPCTGQPK